MSVQIIRTLIMISLSFHPSYTIQCYENSEEFVNSSHAVTCDSSYNACRIRLKIGQRYWSRNCETVTGNQSGCTSFWETNPTVNVTICECDTDLCNEYAHLARLGTTQAPTQPPTTQAPTTPTGTPTRDPTTEPTQGVI